MEQKEQVRIINYPEKEEIQIPVMPLIIIKNDEIMGETKTIRGAVSIVLGSSYFDVEDSGTEWFMRVQEARRASMRAIMDDKYVIVWDDRTGKIKSNYAADSDDEDYEEPNTPPIKINVATDRLFLLSLLKLGEIRILEREDSYLLRPHEDWKTEARKQCCKKCIYKADPGQEFNCPVYNIKRNELEGRDCTSFSINQSNIEEYKGGMYIDLIAQYDIDELIEIVGQKWIFK